MPTEPKHIDPADLDHCPSGWREALLSSVAEIRFSSVDKRSESGERPVRLCNYTDVYNNDYVTADMEFMHATATVPEIERFGLRIGDVIITKDSETPNDIGVPAVIDSSAPDLVCGYHLALIRPNQEMVDPTFLAKQLGDARIVRYFGQQANGSTRYGLSTGSIAAARLRLPDLSRQKVVSQVLRLVDAAIEKTSATIAKLKQVRAGLLHDLLTRGLDDNGELRDPHKHPEQFQDSPLGPIPKDWDVVSVEQVGDVRLGRQRSPAHEVGNHIRPYLRVANVFDGFIDYSDVLSMNFEPAEQETYGLLPGDILLNEGQSLELVGRSAVFPGPAGVFCFQNTLVRFRCFAGADPEFCQLVFKYWLDTRRFTHVAKQTTSVAHLGADRFAKMQFPRPSFSEQKAIAGVLGSNDHRIKSESAGLQKLRDVNSGLKSDLLTGRAPARDTIEAGDSR
jgi:type I restriction enzyme S subunit